MTSPLVVISEIDVTPDVMQRAVDMVEQAVGSLPPAIRPPNGASFFIKLVHDDECPSRPLRDMEHCTCGSLGVHATLITDEEADEVEKLGAYDLMISEGDRDEDLN